jgi:hypothetical protein
MLPVPQRRLVVLEGDIILREKNVSTEPKKILVFTTKKPKAGHYHIRSRDLHETCSFNSGTDEILIIDI